MDCTSTRISYKETGAFSALLNDYLAQKPALRPFYTHPGNWGGLGAALKTRKDFPIDRKALVAHLEQQYAGITRSEKVQSNIAALADAGTFTVTTAHQPNLLTGPLYFIYKILHAIRLAEEAGRHFPGYQFVPVYYMGSEDADLDELGHFFINGEKFVWETRQTGAVGHMKVDDALLALLTRAEGQLAVLPHGKEIIELVRAIFRKGASIQQAMLELVNTLFGEWGLVVMIADSTILKKQMIPVFEKELFEEGASPVVMQTTSNLEKAGYRVQAHPREINLFYLADGIRNRIEKQGSEYIVHQTDIRFTPDAIRQELYQHPEHFSPNVILRGIYQETILPNIAFIGGGGETAYWLQLKDLFHRYHVFYPTLIVRNSFLLISPRQSEVLAKLQIEPAHLFMGEERLMQWIVTREAGDAVTLNGRLEQAVALYDQIKTQAGQVDHTLIAHVDALKTRALQQLQQLEKKMIRAEKRKYNDQRRQLQLLYASLFPNGGLQERVENFMPFYGREGREWLRTLYDWSPGMEQQFTILSFH